MAQAKHPTFVVALTIVLASALAASAFAQAAGRGGSTGSPGGPGRGGPGMETYYPGNDNCVSTRCDPQRQKPKTQHSDHCSPTVTDGKPTPQDCHPQVPPKP